MNPELKREIMLDNYQNPFHKETKGEDFIKANGNNISCIDDINIYIKMKDNTIEDAYFDGEACAISTSSASIMLKKIIGMNIKDILNYADHFENMIHEKKYDQDLLGEALVYDEIYKQQSRIRCATLPYTALRKIIEK